MLPIRFPDTLPTLLGDSIRLRELSEEDIPSWYERATDVESADLAGDPVPDSIAAGAAWLQRHRDKFSAKSGLRWAIVPKDSAVSVGTVGLSIKQDDMKRAELGLVVARSRWGQGIGSVATNLVARYAFSEVGLSEIQAEVLQRNRASLRLLEKTGFTLREVVPPTAGEPEVLLRYALSAGALRPRFT